MCNVLSVELSRTFRVMSSVMSLVCCPRRVCALSGAHERQRREGARNSVL